MKKRIGRPPGTFAPRTAATPEFRSVVLKADRFCLTKLPDPTRDVLRRIKLGQDLADTPATHAHVRLIASRIGWVNVALRGAKPVADEIILPGITLTRTGPNTWVAADDGTKP